MKINIIGVEDSVARLMLVKATEAIIHDDNNYESKIKPDLDSKYELTIQVCGQEVDDKKFIDTMMRTYNESVEHHAKELLVANYNEICNNITEIQEILESHKNIFSTLNEKGE